jgi:NAD(P)-dependent dehydrogenase (short-subunit alcohol dehydrogenase family)
MTRFTDKVCVINGVASEIGVAVAERLTREGGVVVGVDVIDHAVGALALQADLTDEASVESAYRMAFGDLSVVDTTLETWRAVQDANLTATFLACKHGVPHLLATEPSGGSIVNASSFLADIGSATAQMGYAASEAAVVQLTRDLGVHLARSAESTLSSSVRSTPQPNEQCLMGDPKCLPGA